MSLHSWAVESTWESVRRFRAALMYLPVERVISWRAEIATNSSSSSEPRGSSVLGFSKRASVYVEQTLIENQIAPKNRPLKNSHPNRINIYKF